MPAIDLLIFDLDGTLVDSRRDLAEAVNHARRELGFPQLALDEIMQFVGDGLRKLIQRSLSDSGNGDVEQAIKFFRQYYGEHLLDYSHFYAGVENVLDHFSDQMKMAVVSNKPEAFSRAIVSGLGRAGTFATVVGGDSCTTMKPSPEPVLHVTKALGIDPGRAVMIGDSPSDIIAGKAAATLTCGVTYGYRSKELLQRAAPDFLIDHIADLVEFLPQ